MLDAVRNSFSGSRITLRRDVLVVSAPDGSVRVLNLNGNFYALDAIGAELLRESLSSGFDRAISTVATKFAASPIEVGRDLRNLISDLQAHGLITVGAEPARGTSFTVLNLLVVMALRFLSTLQFDNAHRIWILLLLARVSFSAFGLTRTFAIWKRSRLLVPRRGKYSKAEAVAERIRDVAARHWIRMECKERALCCWTVLGWEGIPSSMNIGITLFPLGGHCWCSANDQIFCDDPEVCSMYTPVLCYR